LAASEMLGSPVGSVCSDPTMLSVCHDSVDLMTTTR